MASRSRTNPGRLQLWEANGGAGGGEKEQEPGAAAGRGALYPALGVGESSGPARDPGALGGGLGWEGGVSRVPPPFATTAPWYFRQPPRPETSAVPDPCGEPPPPRPLLPAGGDRERRSRSLGGPGGSWRGP